MDALKHSWLPLAAALLLSNCQSVSSTFNAEDAGVVYALGSRDAFDSPLQKALGSAAAPLRFERGRFGIEGSHEQVLQELAQSWKSKKPRYLIAGYADAGVPEDHARSLSDRRAQAVRQYLIEHGVEAANLQAVGYGNDVTPPGQPATDAVVIYQQ